MSIIEKASVPIDLDPSLHPDPIHMESIIHRDFADPMMESILHSMDNSLAGQLGRLGGLNIMPIHPEFHWIHLHPSIHPDPSQIHMESIIHRDFVDPMMESILHSMDNSLRKLRYNEKSQK